jgi:hypothetical protein
VVVAKTENLSCIILTTMVTKWYKNKYFDRNASLFLSCVLTLLSDKPSSSRSCKVSATIFHADASM